MNSGSFMVKSDQAVIIKIIAGKRLRYHRFLIAEYTPDTTETIGLIRKKLKMQIAMPACEANRTASSGMPKTAKIFIVITAIILSLL